MTSTDAVILTVEGGLARLTLNRPASLNAIDKTAAEQWRDATAEIARRDDIEAVIFDAAGRIFCAGGDVSSMTDSAGESVTRLARVINEGHLNLHYAAKPIVAAVQGGVFGGGIGFMLTADYIVAGESARFGSKYADIGLVPDCGVTTLLPEAVGLRRSLEFTLSDKTLTAAEAAEWGLVTEVVADAQIAERAAEVAAHWMDNATAAFGQARRLLRAAPGSGYEASLDDEAISIGRAVESDEARRRIAAFIAARAR